MKIGSEQTQQNKLTKPNLEEKEKTSHITVHHMSFSGRTTVDHKPLETMGLKPEPRPQTDEPLVTKHQRPHREMMEEQRSRNSGGDGAGSWGGGWEVMEGEKNSQIEIKREGNP